MCGIAGIIGPGAGERLRTLEDMLAITRPIRLAPKRHVQILQSVWLVRNFRPRILDTVHSSSFRQRGIFGADKLAAFLDGQGRKPMGNSFPLRQAMGFETWFQRQAEGLRPAPPRSSQVPPPSPALPRAVFPRNPSAHAVLALPRP